MTHSSLTPAFISALCVFAGATAAQEPPVELDPGVTVRVYKVEPDLRAIPKLVADQTPNWDQLRPTIDLRTPGDFGDVAAPFVTKVTGWIVVAEKGPHEFRLTSDDGSRLTLDGMVVLDHDGRHGVTSKQSGPVELSTGNHPFLIEHFDHAGGKRLTLAWKTPGVGGAQDFAIVPTANLLTERDLTRVTSPGPKKIDDGKRPGDGKPVEGVHPGWTLSTIHPTDFSPMVGAMTFDSSGRLIVGTFSPLQRDDRTLPDIDSKPPDKLFALSNVTATTPDGKPALTIDTSKIKVTECATNLYEPCGLCSVGDALYVSHRKAITRLTDKDRDGYYETHETVAEGWEGWNYHQFTFGLVHHDGHLYATLSTAMAPPGWEGMGTNAAPNGPMRGGVLDVDLSSNTCSIIAGGLRAPNGIGLGPDNTLWYLDNQGAWMSTSQLCHVIPGRFYGHHNRTNFVPKLADRYPLGGVASTYCDRPRTLASVYLPHNELSNSPTQPQMITEGPFKGQMFLGELTGGGIRRVCLEKVNGVWQGAVFQFTQGLEVGVNRMIWGPDGALYAGGIGAGGDWNWRGTKSGLQRLAPNGKVAFEYESIKAANDGFAITFTKRLGGDGLMNPAAFTVKQWTYAPTAVYGGPKVEEETLTVTNVSPSAIGTSVRLTIPGLKANRCVSIRCDPVSDDGERLWSTEAWYTLQQLPTYRPTPAKINERWIDEDAIATGLGVGILPPENAVALLSASADPAFRRGADKQAPRDGARSDEELLALPGYIEIKGTGDLISNTSFADCRIHAEWYCPPGGEGQLAANSGLYIQDLYELQILGTPTRRSDSDFPGNDEAGAIYKFRGPDRNASNGAGEWQAYDIWFRAPRFADQKRTEPARITVYWNGTLIHNDIAIPGPTGARAAKGEPGDRPIQIGPLRLQDHESAAEGSVRFRNIWIAPLHNEKYTPGEWTKPWEAEPISASADGVGGSDKDTLPSGWVIRGGEASLRLAGNTIVGTSKPNTSNTFLVSRTEYDNFELHVDFQLHPKLNSGVQIRSEVRGGFDARSYGLAGPQVELDPSDRAYTGGIYDEQRRGWLYRLFDAPYARRAFKPGAANHLRIVAQGPIIRTWINSVPAAEIFDATDTTGRIAFQVHGVGKETEPMEARFWNLRIRELKSK